MRRKCRWEGCTTPLNSYNKDRCCGAHQRMWVHKMDLKIDELTREIAHAENSYTRTGNKKDKDKVHKLRAKAMKIKEQYAERGEYGKRDSSTPREIDSSRSEIAG